MTYASAEAVEDLTKEIKEGINNTEIYTSLQTRAIIHADKKVNNKIRKKSIPIPTIPENLEELEKDDPLLDLIEAGNLYAAAFMFNTYYSSNDRPSPTAAAHKSDADELVDGYIEWYLENSSSPNIGMPPVGSLVNR